MHTSIPLYKWNARTLLQSHKHACVRICRTHIHIDLSELLTNQNLFYVHKPQIRCVRQLYTRSRIRYDRLPKATTERARARKREGERERRSVRFFLLIKYSIPYTQSGETWLHVCTCIGFIVLVFLPSLCLSSAFHYSYATGWSAQLISRLNIWDGSIQREIDAHNTLLHIDLIHV